MRELTLRVAADGVEDVLDAVLPSLAAGLHVRDGGEAVELSILDGPETPTADELRRLAGPYLIELSEAEVSDDWRARRLGRYRPLVVAERFLLRPDWAPPPHDPELIEIALEQSSAFGSGVHPTTQACLAMLCALEPGGPLADCGCGSGILSIAAAKLGWSPVIAIDVDEASLLTARSNAERNGVEIEARRIDVTSEPIPAADTIVANVPPQIHLGLASALGGAPAQAVVSGFKPGDVDAVTSAWAAHGLKEEERLQVSEWTTLLLR